MIVSVLVWGLLVLVVFPLLQMPVIIYLAQHIESDGDESPLHPRHYETTSRRGQSTQPTQSFESKNENGSKRQKRSGSKEEGESEPPEKSEGTTVNCLYCGTENDLNFTYCRDCVRKLPPVGEYRMSVN